MPDTIKKPRAKVIGQDGNVFNLMAICRDALRKAGKKEDAAKLIERVTASKSYEEALSIMGEYCTLY